MVHYAGAVPTEHGKPPIQSTGAFQTEEQIRHVMVDVHARDNRFTSATWPMSTASTRTRRNMRGQEASGRCCSR